MKEIFNIEKLDHFGRGVSRINDKVLFIENALDHEIVEAEILVDKKKIAEGKTCGLIEVSNERKESECPYYLDCGGCNIMHMKYRKQLDFKISKVRELLEKFAGVERKKIKDIVSSSEFEYRNKVTLKVREKLGFYKSRTYELIAIDKCLVCSHKINEIIDKLNILKLTGIDEVVIRSTYKDESMIIFKVNDNIDDSYYIRNLEGVTDNLIILKDGVYKVLFGKGFITEKLGDYYFKISPGSFFQVNTNQALKLYNLVSDYAKLSGREKVLDLYCGTGTIGIFLSRFANQVVGIEINKDAVDDAMENKKINGINNIEFVCRDINKVIDEYKNIDVVVVDPPRSGLNKKAIDNIFKINAKKIIYISCDPVTLARDINILKSNYGVEEVSLVDMFPNTYHVESVALLNRENLE